MKKTGGEEFSLSLSLSLSFLFPLLWPSFFGFLTFCSVLFILFYFVLFYLFGFFSLVIYFVLVYFHPKTRLVSVSLLVEATMQTADSYKLKMALQSAICISNLRTWGRCSKMRNRKCCHLSASTGWKNHLKTWKMKPECKDKRTKRKKVFVYCLTTNG